MDNPASPLSTEESPPLPFKNWTACCKELKKTLRSITEADHQVILDRIESSPQKIQIAFEMLSSLREGKFSTRFGWLRTPMLGLLGGGNEEPHLELNDVPSEAGAWVYRQLQDVKTTSDWKQFVASGKHLWILHAILSTTSNKQVFVEALTAFAQCAEYCLNTPAAGKSGKKPISAADSVWIAKTIKSKIPAKLDLPKAFIETLFAVYATADSSEVTRRENTGLHLRLKEAGEETKIEQRARSAAEEQAAALNVELEETRASCNQARKALEEERMHNTRQDGFNQVARKETINRVLALVRQGVTHRLENIHAYADRENPDREEIVALVNEIEKHLAGIEEAINP